MTCQKHAAPLREGAGDEMAGGLSAPILSGATGEGKHLDIERPADLFGSCAACDVPLRPEEAYSCDWCADIFCFEHEPRTYPDESRLCPGCTPREPAQRVVV